MSNFGANIDILKVCFYFTIEETLLLLLFFNFIQNFGTKKFSITPNQMTPFLNLLIKIFSEISQSKYSNFLNKNTDLLKIHNKRIYTIISLHK